MDKRTLTLTLGVLLLFLPTLPLAAAFHYGVKADEQPGTDGAVHTERIYRSESEFRYEFSLSSVKYLAIIISLGGCCPSYETGDSLSATIYAPNGDTYPITVEIGECHVADGCSDEHGVPEFYPSGQDWIILVDPPAGEYRIVIVPNGKLKEIPQAQAGAYFWQERANDPTLLGKNIWWYYADGTREFKEDSGYFGWDAALPRILGMSVLAVTGWAAGIVLLVRARKMKRQEPEL